MFFISFATALCKKLLSYYILHVVYLVQFYPLQFYPLSHGYLLFNRLLPLLYKLAFNTFLYALNLTSHPTLADYLCGYTHCLWPFLSWIAHTNDFIIPFCDVLCCFVMFIICIVCMGIIALGMYIWLLCMHIVGAMTRWCHLGVGYFCCRHLWAWCACVHGGVNGVYICFD